MLLTPLLVLFFLAPGTLALSLISKWLARKNEVGKRVAGTATAISVIAFFGVILYAIMLPSNSFLHRFSTTRQCETDLMEIGTAMDEYMHDHGAYPESLDDLLYSGYLSTIPQFMNNDPYPYAVGFTTRDTMFIILCPQPRALLKDRGLLPAARIKEMKYVEDQGLVIVTE
jgi:hypothetical protein